MAGPLAGISAAQIAQQKLPDQAAQQAKAGPSKFDQSLKGQGPDAAGKVGHAQQVQQVQKLDQIKHVDQVQKMDKAGLNKLDKNVTGKGMDPVAQKTEVSKSSSMMSSMMANLEKGQAHIDKLINGGISNGKSMSNQELLSMQAGMYKYTQELDLVSKVVEKATSGLKDTLKTQV
ncbi:MAG: ATP-dependent helicase HrpB [Archangium sp.]|nr:ATP-dependent helicase HrpB [Archangium sp.]MDP3151745.1 ATP-dependent helicase HrpB [Archangium sp.]MDP3573263.1 ATP-dependent helicase HrpB [Archangium sp.]